MRSPNKEMERRPPRLQVLRLHTRPSMPHATPAPARRALRMQLRTTCLLMRIQVETTHARFTSHTRGECYAPRGLPLHALGCSLPTPANVAT
jgi:hypothetical protein